MRKAISIKLGDRNQAAVCFDTQTVRMAFGWTGEFLKLPVAREGLEGYPIPKGEIQFSSSDFAGWVLDDKFNVARPPKHEALPKEQANYRGLFLHEKKVVLDYSVGTTRFLELPEFVEIRDNGIFFRTFFTEKIEQACSVLVCDAKEAIVTPMGKMVLLEFEDSADPENYRMIVLGISGNVNSRWKITPDNRVYLSFPQTSYQSQFQIAYSIGPTADTALMQHLLNAKNYLPDLAVYCYGGKNNWPDTITTTGILGQKEQGAYIVDSITLPIENPWNSWLRTSGFDFYSDGRAAICSISGDVWVVKGLNEKLDKLEWQRFATGLYQPLGLRIIDDQVYVLGRDQITRLKDINGDLEADHYENFNSDISISNQYHEFCLNLETDSEGNFYFTKGDSLGSTRIPHHGSLIKISADGSRLESLATGFRAPNGLSVGPNNEITVSDNQGNWVPASRINLIQPGGFYGYVPAAHQLDTPTQYNEPICWIPHEVDNSSGGQIWVQSDTWGELKGQMLHTSYGRSGLFLMLTETINNQMQGGVVRLPLLFASGIMRGRFSPIDGQLYLAGLRVWQSNAARDAAFHRVRYTGGSLYLPVSLNVHSNGVMIRFSDPLDRVFAEDSENFMVEQWNYQWTSEYGSKDYSVKSPQSEGRDEIAITGVRLSEDARSVFLELEGLSPVMQMKIQYSLLAEDGAVVENEIFNTIHSLGATY